MGAGRVGLTTATLDARNVSRRAGGRADPANSGSAEGVGTALMNATSDRRPTPELMAHFESFDSPWGRRRLQLYLAWKRLTWRWVIRGAHIAKRALDLAGS